MKSGFFLFLSFLFFCFLLFLLPLPDDAQVEHEEIAEIKTVHPAEFSFGADLVSRYVWRGTDYGNSPAIQPNVSFSIAEFKIGAWGSYGFVPYSKEINDSTTKTMGNFVESDLNISYTFKGFTLMVTDYFFPNPLCPNEDNRYFNYDNKTTGHTFEASLFYSGPESFPIQLFAGMHVYGADKGKDSTGVCGAGNKNNYSSYLETSYQFNVKGIGVKPFIGGIPYESSWYGRSAGIVNLGVTLSKDIRVTKDYSIPVYTSIVINPQTQSVFFVFGLTI